MSQTSPDLELRITDGKTKDGRQYQALDLLLDDRQFNRLFIKPTELPFYSEIVGIYERKQITK